MDSRNSNILARSQNYERSQPSNLYWFGSLFPWDFLCLFFD
jgi:hypothetical protein